MQFRVSQAWARRGTAHDSPMAYPKVGDRGGQNPTVDACLWHGLLTSNPYATLTPPIPSHVRGMVPETRIEKSHSGRTRILGDPRPLMVDSTLKALAQEHTGVRSQTQDDGPLLLCQGRGRLAAAKPVSFGTRWGSIAVLYGTAQLHRRSP